MIRTAFYAGSFDPITLGHVDIIERAGNLFDRVIVGIAKSERKSPLFDVSTREKMIHAALAHLDYVSIVPVIGLTVDCVKVHHASHLLRGIRSYADYDYEMMVAEMNRRMADMETVFLSARPEWAHVSSSIARELIALQAFEKLEQCLPKSVIAIVKEMRSLTPEDPPCSQASHG